MKLGAGTYAWSAQGYSLEDSIREIASLKIGYIDILGTGHGHPAAFTLEGKKDIRKLMDDLGVSASSVLALYEGNIAGGDERERDPIREYMKQVLEFCGILGAGQILYKPGDKIIGIPNTLAWANSVAFSREMAALARPYNILLTFELVPRPFALVQTIEEMERYLADIERDNVFANLDLGHVALARDGADDVAAIASRTVHAHLNDNDTFDHTNDVVGTGSAPIGEYITALAAHGAEATCRGLGLEFVAGIEIEVSADRVHDLTPLDINRQCRDYVLEHIPEITL